MSAGRLQTVLRDLFSRRGRFEQGVAFNVASLAVLGVSGIAINLLIARFGGAQDLGVFNQAYAVYIFASQLAVGGVQFSVLHSISRQADDPQECARIASSALALAALTSLGVGALVAATRGAAGRLLDSPGVETALLALAPGLVLFSINKVILSVLNGLRQMRAFAVFQALRFVFILLGVGVILWLGIAGELLAGAFSLAEGLLLILLAVYVERRVAPIRWRQVRRRWLRRHVAFGWKSFLSGTLSELNTRVDVLTLGLFLSDRVVGIYSFAAIFAEGLNQLPYVVRNNLDPLLGNRFADGDLRRIEWYSRKIRSLFWPGMALLGVVAVGVYSAMIGLLFADGDFAASGGVFAILVLGIVLSAGYRPFLGILLQGGEPARYTQLTALIVAGNLAGNLLLIPVFGMHGAAAATAAALVAEALLVVIYARRLFGVRL